jgi:hypothetical protein
LVGSSRWHGLCPDAYEALHPAHQVVLWKNSLSFVPDTVAREHVQGTTFIGIAARAARTAFSSAHARGSAGPQASRDTLESVSREAQQ